MTAMMWNYPIAQRLKGLYFYCDRVSNKRLPFWAGQRFCEALRLGVA
jgi:hypothetical protein